MESDTLLLIIENKKLKAENIQLKHDLEGAEVLAMQLKDKLYAARHFSKKSEWALSLGDFKKYMDEDHDNIGGHI